MVLQRSGWLYNIKIIFNKCVRVFTVICTQGENGRTEVSDLVYLTVEEPKDVQQIMKTAQANKSTARTDMNERSSRRWVRSENAESKTDISST